MDLRLSPMASKAMNCRVRDMAPDPLETLCRLLGQPSEFYCLRMVCKGWYNRTRPFAVDELIGLSGQKGRFTRVAAVAGLARAADPGDRRAILAVLERLCDSRDDVRQAAVQALPRLVVQGDFQTVETLVALASSLEPLAREAALDVLGHVVPQGDAEVSAVATARLSDPDLFVRQAALRTLAEVSSRGDRAAVTLIAERLEDPDLSMQQTAMTALCRLAEKGDKRLIGRIATLANDKAQWQVRCTALETLTQISRRGEPYIAETITDRLDDEDWPVRRAAVDTLAMISEKGDQDAIDAIATRLNDCHPCVRYAAAHGLSQIGKFGDPDVVVLVAQKLEDRHWLVQKEAFVALECVAGTDVAKRLQNKALAALAGEQHAHKSNSSATPSAEAMERWAQAKAHDPLPGGAQQDGVNMPIVPETGAQQAKEGCGNVRDQQPEAIDLQPHALEEQQQAELRQEEESRAVQQQFRKQEAILSLVGGWIIRGARCNLCSKKVTDEQGGVVCRRRRADGKNVGCGEGVCWRCMKRAPRDSFGAARTTKEEFESWGDDAWWMHEWCMETSDWAEFFGEAVEEEAEGKVDKKDCAHVVGPTERAVPMDASTATPVDANGTAGAGLSPQGQQNSCDGASIERMSVKQLKAFLTAREVGFADCVEKADLVARAKGALAS